MEKTSLRDTNVIYSDGSVSWVPPYRLTSTCKFDTVWFPFDEQTCLVKFGSWTYNGFTINLSTKDDSGADISSFVQNDEYDLVEASVKRNEVVYECCPEPYLDITFSIKLRRWRSSHYITHNIPASFLASILAVLTTLLSSRHSQTSKIFILCISLVIESSLSVSFAASNSVYNQLLGQHTGKLVI